MGYVSRKGLRTPCATETLPLKTTITNPATSSAGITIVAAQTGELALDQKEGGLICIPMKHPDVFGRLLQGRRNKSHHVKIASVKLFPSSRIQDTDPHSQKDNCE